MYAPSAGVVLWGMTGFTHTGNGTRLRNKQKFCIESEGVFHHMLVILTSFFQCHYILLIIALNSVSRSTVALGDIHNVYVFIFPIQNSEELLFLT